MIFYGKTTVHGIGFSSLVIHKTWKQKYKDHYKKFGKYISCYAVVKKLWNRLERWITQNVPNMMISLEDGATEAQLDEVEACYQLKYPIEVRCFYRYWSLIASHFFTRIHNGQKKMEQGPCKLFAGFRLLNLQEIKGSYCKEMRGFPLYFVRKDLFSNSLLGTIWICISCMY